MERINSTSMNPVDQFIEIAPDCLLKAAVIPVDKGVKRTIASIEYELLAANPYVYTLAELQFVVNARRNEISDEDLIAQRQSLWDAFFSKPHACMRASALTKKFGWGVHYDKQGKIALYAVESREYQRFVKDGNIKKYFAMRSKRGAE
ncbi:hypothetical protein GALL_145360 [mine drainage metagenome]|uniref:Uncharacterized protein n=1 Tax=mine drainage metagenome TaxID=410659 RepID=A0A1J5SGU0_9ZZZZ